MYTYSYTYIVPPYVHTYILSHSLACSMSMWPGEVESCNNGVCSIRYSHDVNIITEKPSIIEVSNFYIHA